MKEAVQTSKIANGADGFIRTMDALNLLLGLKQIEASPIMTYVQFGFHGYSIDVFPAHINYVGAINAVIVPHLPTFDADSIERWKLLNELLLVTGLTGELPNTDRIIRHSTNLAALVAFPTLEHVSRCISNRWDEEGILSEDVPSTDGVRSWKPDGSMEPKTYKKGQRIVLLSHKLQLMDLALHPRLSETIKSLDLVLRRPMDEGMAQPMSPLYDRLQFFRDLWSHGRRFRGFEALLISMILGLIYFGTLRLREETSCSSELI
jgi:hypothetical protein